MYSTFCGTPHAEFDFYSNVNAHGFFHELSSDLLLSDPRHPH